MKNYVIDGAAFSSLEGFFEEISRVVIPTAVWGHNLDAFNDILRGGFGTPESGFQLIWRNHAISKERLGYAETARQLENRLSRCQPASRKSIALKLAAARAGSGPTVFDWLVEIIQSHGTGGIEATDNVRLSLR
jgi:RNAse (barnase) inhibitor barstar